MALYIQTNTASLDAQRNLSMTQLSLSQSFARLSSGYRINGSADDAAGLGISDSLTAQIRSWAVAGRNANDGISMAQTADGTASQITSMLQRMRELAVESSNGALQSSDRANLNTEFQDLTLEINRISASTTFNGTNLLNGNTTVNFQVGIGTASSDQIAVAFGGMDTTSLALNGLDVTSVANAQTTINALDAAMQQVATTRAGFGATINRLQVSVQNIQSMQENLSAANSRIRDVDVAAETSKMAQEQVLSQAGAAVLSQANQVPQLALTLLKGG
jgi:flagellin